MRAPSTAPASPTPAAAAAPPSAPPSAPPILPAHTSARGGGEAAAWPAATTHRRRPLVRLSVAETFVRRGDFATRRGESRRRCGGRRHGLRKQRNGATCCNLRTTVQHVATCVQRCNMGAIGLQHGCNMCATWVQHGCNMLLPKAQRKQASACAATASISSSMDESATFSCSPGTDVGRGEPSLCTDVAGVGEPSPDTDVGGGEPSPGTDVGRAVPSPGADVGRAAQSLCHVGRAGPIHSGRARAHRRHAPRRRERRVDEVQPVDLDVVRSFDRPAPAAGASRRVRLCARARVRVRQ